MAEVLQFLIDYGYIVLFLWVALDQAALPVHSIPMLVGAGALAGLGELSLALVFVITMLACLPINHFWFWLGRLERTGALIVHPYRTRLLRAKYRGSVSKTGPPVGGGG